MRKSAGSARELCPYVEIFFASVLALAAAGAAAQQAGSTPPLATAGPAASDGAPAAPAAPAEAITVTGSYLRRTDAESSSPITRITAEDISKSGLNTLADVIRSVSADNSGTLTQTFSGAMAGGASGVALRGLTVDATLVLIDGHRMAPYPLADDGQRPFTDISSLPMGIVDHVEVLRDGASALYGSDAIAGVVNIILKKQFTGIEISAAAGTSYKLDGGSERLSALYGFGDLGADGHNVYFNLEARHQDSIGQEARGSYLTALNLTPYGGSDLRGGINNGNLPIAGTTYTVPGQVIPLANGQPLAAPYLLPGCSAQNFDPNGGCAWDTNVYKKLQPRNDGLNFTGRWTQNLPGGWQSTANASIFQSESEQYRQPNGYDVGTTLVPFAWAGSKSGTVNQFDTQTTQIVLPPNAVDNPFNPRSPYYASAQSFYGSAFSQYAGLPALFFGALTDIPPQHSLYRTDVLRLVEDLSGNIGAWDVNASIGYIDDATHVTYVDFVRASRLYAALASGNFYVGQNAYLNSPALLASLTPETEDTATSNLSYLTLNASRPLLALPGGDLALAAGVEARRLSSENPGQPYGPEGDIMMDGSFYAEGSQNVYAAFTELSAPLLRSLELDAATRLDHYQSTGLSVTPKFGFKWRPVQELAFRGTYARGFRAPGIAESGNAGSGSSVSPAPVDPLRCPYTNAVADCGGIGSTVAVLVRSNPDLKPEKSHSLTLGFIFEPLPRLNLTVDYFRIRRDGEIAPAPYSLTGAIRTAATPGTAYPGQIIGYLTPFVNASYSLTSGFDVELSKKFLLGEYGNVTAKLEGTHLLEQQQTFGDQTYHYVGTVGPTALSGATGTPATRGAVNLDWTRGPLSLGAIYNYRSAMEGIDESLGLPATCIQLSSTNPHCYVSSFFYTNLYAQYQWNDHLQITATVANVTNKLAPLDTATYGGQNYDPSFDQAGAIGRYFELGFRYRL